MADRVIEFQVPEGVKTARADKLFAAEFEDVSRARLQRAFDASQVTFEGEVISKRFKVMRPGLLRAVLVEEASEAPPKPVDIPLKIVFEDESLIVINKSPGMVTHPGNGTGRTLWFMLSCTTVATTSVLSDHQTVQVLFTDSIRKRVV